MAHHAVHPRRQTMTTMIRRIRTTNSNSSCAMTMKRCRPTNSRLTRTKRRWTRMKTKSRCRKRKRRTGRRSTSSMTMRSSRTRTRRPMKKMNSRRRGRSTPAASGRRHTPRPIRLRTAPRHPIAVSESGDGVRAGSRLGQLVSMSVRSCVFSTRAIAGVCPM
jgi:hypothetical protein